MKPLLYSEREATARGLGWKRVGSHISYYKTSLYKNPLLHREYVYYTLTFHMVSYTRQVPTFVSVMFMRFSRLSLSGKKDYSQSV